MRGLKTQEENNFIAFFERVQDAAAKRHSVFFLECGEGNEFSAKGIEGEDLRGWLIPESKADRFERIWLKENPGEEWENNIAWAIWSGKPDNPTIVIKQF